MAQKHQVVKVDHHLKAKFTAFKTVGRCNSRTFKDIESCDRNIDYGPPTAVKHIMTEEETFTSQQIKYRHWQGEFAAALDGDPTSLRKRVDAAESAIFTRLQSLDRSARSQAERQAIADAIRSLRAIQVEKLGYPSWNRI